MFNQETTFTITVDHITQYATHLQEQERAKNTVKKYVHDLHSFMEFLEGQPVTKGTVIAWKEHLVDAARRRGKERLALLLQTLCATGIRVSELRFITAEAVALGRTVVSNKGKRRIVFCPESCADC